MTSNPRSREAAYADLVGGLIDARVDVASERFDAELEAAEAAGRLDPAAARLLRWWQRESVRAVTEHARSTIPSTLVALERAAADARDAVHRADAAWTTARGVSARATYPGTAYPSTEAPAPAAEPPAPAPTPSPAPAPAPSAWTEPPAAEAPAVPTPTPMPPTFEPPGYPGDPLPSASLAQPAPGPAAAAETPSAAAPAGGLPAHLAGVEEVALPPESGYTGAGDEAPAIVDLTDPPAASGEQDEGATPPSGRRRTLLAGLTVLPKNEE